MICRRYAQPFLVAGSLALAVAGTAASSQRPADQTAPKPMTVTGCLQKTTGLVGADYILTERISTSPVGTNGSSAAAQKVEAEKERAAEHSYRLSGETGNLKNLVGHQVRVTGVLADRADIAKEKNDSNKEIDKGDLAKIDVKSVDDVAASCGGRISKK